MFFYRKPFFLFNGGRWKYSEDLQCGTTSQTKTRSYSLKKRNQTPVCDVHLYYTLNCIHRTQTVRTPLTKDFQYI